MISFYVFLEDENNYFANYADDTTPYFVGSTTAEALENLSYPKSCLTGILIPWFANNQMIASNDRFHLILSSPDEDAAIQTEESRIKCSKVKKLLGI